MKIENGLRVTRGTLRKTHLFEGSGVARRGGAEPDGEVQGGAGGKRTKKTKA